MWVYGLNWPGPGQRQVADVCECGNEPSGSAKCGEFLDQLQTSQLLKKDSAPCSKYKGVVSWNHNLWLERKEKTARRHFLWTVGVASKQISVLRKNAYSFGNI